MTKPISTLFLGGCLIHGPISDLIRAGDTGIVPARLSRGGGTPGTYTFGEMFQAIALYRGEIAMSPEIRNLCGVRLAFEALPGAGSFASVDVAIVEPVSPVEIKFREYTINREAIVTRWQLFAVAETDIVASDRFRSAGVIYEVDGDVQVWSDHVEALLKRVVG